MLALITGASSGIGKEMALYLGELGYDLILVARRKEKLEELQQKIKTKVIIYPCDLLKIENVYKLYEDVKEKRIDFLINNAGFGLFGFFTETDLKRELEMMDLNIRTYHILTKLILQDFQKRDQGRILNVASAASFLAGPSMSTYYATKNYIAKLTLGIYEELRQNKSNVHISILCPGPTATEFAKNAEGEFLIEENSARKVARIGIDKALKNKLIIIPSVFTRMGILLNRFIPWKVSLRFIYRIQKKKKRNVK